MASNSSGVSSAAFKNPVVRRCPCAVAIHTTPASSVETITCIGLSFLDEETRVSLLLLGLTRARVHRLLLSLAQPCAPVAHAVRSALRLDLLDDGCRRPQTVEERVGSRIGSFSEFCHIF